MATKKVETAVTGSTLAYSLLEKNKTVKERAEFYHSSIQRNLQRLVIDSLIERRDSLQDELFDKSNFSLDTNLNAGQRTMTKEDCENRFKCIMDIEYELELVNLELESKQAIFKKYFG